MFGKFINLGKQLYFFLLKLSTNFKMVFRWICLRELSWESSTFQSYKYIFHKISLTLKTMYECESRQNSIFHPFQMNNYDERLLVILDFWNRKVSRNEYRIRRTTYVKLHNYCSQYFSIWHTKTVKNIG